MRTRVILLGRLLADPEVYYTPTGDQVARFDLTTMEATPAEPRRLRRVAGRSSRGATWLLTEWQIHARSLSTMATPLLLAVG